MAVRDFPKALRSEKILDGSIHGRYFNKIVDEFRRPGKVIKSRFR